MRCSPSMTFPPSIGCALAADEVWMAEHVVANPHYKDMGNLYGSEYWTYLLPRRVGDANAKRLTEIRWPIGIAEAERLGLVQRRLPAGRDEARAEIIASGASRLCGGEGGPRGGLPYSQEEFGRRSRKRTCRRARPCVRFRREARGETSPPARR